MIDFIAFIPYYVLINHEFLFLSLILCFVHNNVFHQSHLLQIEVKKIRNFINFLHIFAHHYRVPNVKVELLSHIWIMTYFTKIKYYAIALTPSEHRWTRAKQASKWDSISSYAKLKSAKKPETCSTQFFNRYTNGWRRWRMEYSSNELRIGKKNV